MTGDKQSAYPGETITVQPLKAFPVIKDCVADVSWNYRQNQRIKPFTPQREFPRRPRTTRMSATQPHICRRC